MNLNDVLVPRLLDLHGHKFCARRDLIAGTEDFWVLIDCPVCFSWNKPTNDHKAQEQVTSGTRIKKYLS